MNILYKFGIFNTGEYAICLTSVLHYYSKVVGAYSVHYILDVGVHDHPCLQATTLISGITVFKRSARAAFRNSEKRQGASSSGHKVLIASTSFPAHYSVIHPILFSYSLCEEY